MDDAVENLQRHFDVVIVGGGHAGGACALALRRLKYAGTIAVFGDEPVAPYERPSLSKEMLEGKETTPRFLLGEEEWERTNIALYTGESVVSIERHNASVVLAGGRGVRYGTLVLATGGRARKLPYPPHSRLRSLRSEDDSRAIADLARKSGSVIVIGGGVIGLEAAASLRSQNLDVTVIEVSDRLLSRNVPGEVASWIEKLHSEKGCTIHKRQTIAAIECGDDGVAIALKEVTLRADFAIAGIGIVPDIALAQACGLACNTGVLVDAGYRCLSDRTIFAIGDIASRVDAEGVAPEQFENWAHAQGSAEIAARGICGLPPNAPTVAWFWTSQYKHTLQLAGVFPSEGAVIARGDRIRVYLDRAGAVVAAAMLDAPKDFAIARKLIAQRARMDTIRARDPSIDLRNAVVIETGATALAKELT